MNKVISKDFWKNKRVLITGHTGFKGTWLTLWLQSLGAHCFGYALSPGHSPNLWELLHLKESITHIDGDILNFQALSKVIQEVQPEIVIHLAAQAFVGAAHRKPLDTLSINVLGTAHVLEALRSVSKAKMALIVTSDKCYQRQAWGTACTESTPLGGDEPYSASKACAEIVTHCYRESYFSNPKTGPVLALATARAGNVVGGGDWGADRLVPDIIQALMSKKSILLRNPEAVRPWQFVLEPLSGYLRLIEACCKNPSQFSSEWNFGPSPEHSVSVLEISNQLADAWGTPLEHAVANETYSETAWLQLNTQKAEKLLGWRPRLNLKMTLDWIVEWYRAYESGGDLREVCLKQINQYCSLRMS